MKNKTLFIIIFLLFFPLFLRAEEVTLSLDEAISVALRDNCEVLLSAEELKKAKEKIAEAYGPLWPSLDFNGGYTRLHGLSEKDIATTTTQTTFKQIIYQGGKTINTIKYSKFGLEAAQAVLDKTKLETVLNVKKAYYTLLLSTEFSNLNKHILDNTKEHLMFLKARYKEGQASQSDILNIEKSLKSVEQAYETSLNQVESAQVLLKNLLYLDDKVRPKPSIQLHYEPEEVAYDEAFLSAMKNRPEIRQLEAKANAAKSAIEIAKADGRPTILASWEYFSRSNSGVIASGGTVTGASSTTSSKGWNDYSTLGFVFSWPVFDGWVTKAKVEQAIVDLKQAQLLKEQTARDIAAELKNAYLSLKNAIAQIRTAESEIALYQDNLSVVKKQKTSGITSSLDLDDAELKYRISSFNKKQAAFDYIVAKATFDKAMGG
ncbi:MAG: TolC family protein [Candidatus Omnitrophica bacterium]|nr:TolC family protein [Candidatus Omnitrophota bacterium]